MPILCRRNPQDPTHLAPCTLADLDPNRRTLFIFPGREACCDMKNNYDGLFGALRLAEHTLQFDYNENKEQLQIAVMQWDKHVNTLDRFESLKKNPAYASEPAKAFMHELKARGFTAPVSILAWSGGTTFLQQCANAPDKADNVQVLTLGTPLSKEMIARGFPGIYSVGTNDLAIAEHMPGIQDEINLESRSETLSIIPVPQEGTGTKHAVVVAGPVPHVVQRLRAPNKPFDNYNAHAAMGYLKAEGESYARKASRTIPATMLSAINARGLNNIVRRDATLSPEQMLEEKPGLFARALPDNAATVTEHIAAAREGGQEVRL